MRACTKKRLVVTISKRGIVQFIKFSCVGASNSLVYLLVYYAFTATNNNARAAMIGQAFAWLLSVTNSFIWNRKFVFENSQKRWWVLLLRVYACYAFSLAISSALTFLQVEILGVPNAIVPMVNLLAMGPVNFFIVKYFAFGKSGKLLDDSYNG